ncbi:metal ABC transporter solute-binding protein, Zn/Mn family [Sessilibacter sp. MAH2]
MSLLSKMFNHAFRVLLSVTLIALFCAKVNAGEAKPVVLASNQPLYLLLQELLQDRAVVTRLMPLGVSPHGFQMSFSQRNSVAKADTVVWVGASLEPFLSGVLSTKDNINTSQLTGIVWPVGYAESHVHEGHDDHDHGAYDPHLWLNPDNSLVIAKAVIEHLNDNELLTASDKKALNEQYLSFEASIHQLNNELSQQLQPVHDVPFVVFHDALGHFQQRFGLQQYQVITKTPEQRPGAKHLAELRKTLTHAQCLLVEPYYRQSQALRLRDEFALTMVEIDILGQNATSYSDLIKTLGHQFQQCLSAKP